MAIGKGQIAGSGSTSKVQAMHGRLFTNKRSKKIQLIPALPSPKKPPPSPPKRKQKISFQPAAVEQGEFVQIQRNIQSSANANRSKDSNDYMAEWIPKVRAYLSHIVGREASPTVRTCSRCYTNESPTWWRCKECLGTPLFCHLCSGDAHMEAPFHRVETLENGFFLSSWLWQCGVVVDLCPNKKCSDSVHQSDMEESGDELNDPERDWFDTDDFTFGARPQGRYHRGNRVLVFVHTNGVHHLPVHFCLCDNAPGEEFQLLSFGFYPATSRNVRTVFTFPLLDDYLLQTLECFTSTHHFFTKLRRITNEPFPATVPDRTRELRRVGRQWRRLKELKRSGFSHVDRAPGKGELALFCAACPQPGVNLPPNWKDDPEQWKFTRSFVADGNFTCIHRRLRTPEDSDVSLKDGEGYITEKTSYAKHLATSTETTEPPTCHEHRAIADKSRLRKGLDVTGIGAIACMRHGAFAPGSVVDFQKGERHINMDYALSEALKLTVSDEISKVLFVYDINCQYSKHLLKRLREGEFLTLREDLVFVHGIGLFHVHGHQESCHARYSLTFIEGAGVSSGEILESLWAVVNEVARATSTMSLAHRTEVLDAILGDINWKKLIQLVPTTCKNWLNCRIQLSDAREAFELLNETATPEQRARWKEELDEAQRNRLNDVSSMDILNPKINKPPTMAKVRTNLMEKEKQMGAGIGVTSWIAFGIKIQQAQMRLKSFIRTLPKNKTDEQELEISKRREQIYADINSFYETASSLFPEGDLTSLKLDEPPPNPITLDDDYDSDEEIEDDNPFSLAQNQIEDVKIPLPSSASTIESVGSFSLQGLRLAQEKELKLRIAQADDALEAVRVEIGHKSYLYRSNIRLAEGKKQKTRGYTAVKSVNRSIRDHVRSYNQARWAMHRLGADDTLKLRYRAIKPEDTRAVTAIYKPNARGERNKPLPWIWNMDVAGDSTKSEYLEELYRVNWLRARSRLDRWREEYTLLSSEMHWILNFFEAKQRDCRSWAQAVPESPGHVAYAKRQENMWRLMYVQAEKLFTKTRNSVE
ncbi:hypothetical protein CC1G_15640 [Coprinopsis cinerea okayama7|uniref:CxC2-like cysteine cluster KDZ transposase-associated domain-containing protein n=1 Tax=Coprinopsis cinerea (strain Okayama-7 / 130 / ATCC MYA-4618 / FGSC 9003) TaxID=240176 RepID=D6RQA3_COPC7|nr:hypothetical protein CC1G_15640 [Coprinopsis cinerea okayama7\|eukprot:XP_002910213.1 hypothetical protein CC1G_15640 [Coprinopsis cinerea okayama7\